MKGCDFYFQEAIGEYTFLIFLVLMVGFTLFVYFLVPETKNKTFEEIASTFQPGGTIEVEEICDDVFDDKDMTPDDAAERTALMNENDAHRKRNGSVPSRQESVERVTVDFSKKAKSEEKMHLTKSEENLQNLDV